MNLSDYVLDFLVKKKVKKVFLITGGAISFMVDSFFIIYVYSVPFTI